MEKGTTSGSDLQACLENRLVISGTILQYRTIRKLTWVSPDERTKNQIDHITINQKWKSSMKDVKALRLADASNDHNFLLCKL